MTDFVVRTGFKPLFHFVLDNVFNISMPSLVAQDYCFGVSNSWDIESVSFETQDSSRFTTVCH
jgi:hypothetical protein